MKKDNGLKGVLADLLSQDKVSKGVCLNLKNACLSGGITFEDIF